MLELRLPVAVTMRRTPLANRWVTERWEPVAVELRSESGPVAARTDAEWVFNDQVVQLHRSEAEGYHLNLTAPEPKVFVMWRMSEPEELAPGGPAARPHVVTVSYHEAARMLDGGEQVDALPLPPGIRAWMEPFVAEHYKPEPKRKVRRRDPLQDGADEGGSKQQDGGKHRHDG